MSRTVTEVIQDHLMKRLAGQVDRDIEENYSPDIVVLSSFGKYSGHAGVKASAQKLADVVGDAVFAYNHTLIEGEFGFLEWTAESDNKKVCDGTDSFVVRDGRIVLQTVHYTAAKK